MASGNPFTSAQAPAYNLIAPDIGAEQAKLARQQQMADLLRSQAMQPDQGTQVVNGWAIKKSPWEGISKIAAALGGGYLQKKADDKQLGLAKAMQERMSSAFDGMAGGGSARASSNSAPAMPVSPQDQPLDSMQVTEGSPSMTSPAQQAAPAQPQMDQITKIRNQAKAAYMMGNTELANKLLENISTLTTEQRNMAARGQDPALMGQLGIAKARKDGMFEMQPGTTSINMLNGQERFQPKVGEGITLNGGQASAIPGYAGANAEISGANAAAVSGANAQNEMTTVNTPNGPVMMTKAQAVQMAGGGAPQTGTHFTNPDPAGMSLNFKGNPQAVFDQLSKLPEPHRAEALAAFSQYAGQPAGAPAAPGIKLQSAAEAEQEVGQVRNNLAIEKSRIENAQSPEQQQKIVDSQGLVGLLDAADPLLAGDVATSSVGGQLRDKVTGAFGVSTDASKAAAQLAAIGGALVSKMPKMSGPQSDKDVMLYKEMAGRLGDSSVPIGDRQAAAQILRNLTEKYLAANQGSVANQALQRNMGVATIKPANRTVPASPKSAIPAGWTVEKH